MTPEVRNKNGAESGLLAGQKKVPLELTVGDQNSAGCGSLFPTTRIPEEDYGSYSLCTVQTLLSPPPSTRNSNYILKKWVGPFLLSISEPNLLDINVDCPGRKLGNA